MDRVIEMGAARELVADTALWPLIRDFLWDFAPQVHESRLAGIVGYKPLGENLVSSFRVKKWILSQLDVKPFFHGFPKDDWSRVALLDGAVVEAVVKWLGALVFATPLRMITDGATVRSLKASLPGIYPDVFGFTAYFKGLGDPPASLQGVDAQSIVDSVVEKGCGLLLELLSGAPEHVRERLRLKLPDKPPFNAPAWNVPRERRAGLDVAFARLLKLKFPEAHSLCCS